MSGLDLYQTQSELLSMLARAAVTGFCLGGLYDLLRALRILSGLESGEGRILLYRAVLFFTDLWLVLTASVSLILLCYYTNDGLFRAPILWGMAGGFLLYTHTVGRLTVKAERALFRLIKRTITAILTPIRRILSRITAGTRRFLKKLWISLFGKAIEARRRKRAERQTQGQSQRNQASSAEPPLPTGKTVFSTRGHP